MKNIIYLMFLIYSVFFIGCAEISNQAEVVQNKITGNRSASVNLYNLTKVDEIENIKNLTKEENSFATSLYKYKYTMKAIAEDTLKEKKIYFVLLNKSINQKDGTLPINDFLKIKEYCFNKIYSEQKVGTELKCGEILSQKSNSEVDFEILNNDIPYTVMAMDAREVLKEINAYTITKAEVSLAKEKK